MPALTHAQPEGWSRPVVWDSMRADEKTEVTGISQEKRGCCTCACISSRCSFALFQLLFYLVFRLSLLWFPECPPFLFTECPLLWYPIAFYCLNVPPVVPRMSPTLPLPLSSRGSPSVPRVHYGLPHGAPQGLPEASLGAPGGTEAQNGFRIAFRCLFRSSSETRKID